jgi:hypothetical protein
MSNTIPSNATGWQNTYSTKANGFGNPVQVGNFLSVFKAPPFDFKLPKNWNYFLGRWEVADKVLKNFKQIQIGDGKTQLQWCGPVALVNQLFFGMCAAQGFQSTKIYVYDPDTLEVVRTSNEIQAPGGLMLQAGQGRLFATQMSSVTAYDPDFNSLFQINLDPTAFQIPFFAFYPDSFLCASCNGAAATFDYQGKQISETKTFNDHGLNPWIIPMGETLALIGFTDGITGNSYFQTWQLDPLAMVGPEYAIVNRWTGSGINTTAGVLLAGSEILSLGSYPSFQPNYSLYTFEINQRQVADLMMIDPQTIVTMDQEVKIWEYTPPTQVPTEKAISVQQVTPPNEPTSVPAPWQLISSFDLTTIAKDGQYWSIIGADENNHLFLYEQISQTLYQMVIDSTTHQITAGKSHTFKGEAIFVNPFLAQGHLYASINNNNSYSSLRLNPATLEAENLEIYNQIYSLDDKTLADLYVPPMPSGSYTSLPDNTVTIYDSATMNVISSFNISGFAPATLVQLGKILIGVGNDGQIITYDRKGNILSQGATGFKSLNSVNATPVDANHFLVPIDDYYRQESTVQLWQLNPLQQVDSESYQMGSFDISSISPTPQGTILSGKQATYYVGPYPHFSDFATVVKDASGQNVTGPCLPLPNNQAALINGNTLQLFQIGSLQSANLAASVSKGWCEVQ